MHKKHFSFYNEFENVVIFIFISNSSSMVDMMKKLWKDCAVRDVIQSILLYYSDVFCPKTLIIFLL